MVRSCVSSVLHPFCRLSTLRCCVPPPARGRGWVLSACLIGMWSLLFQSVRQVEDFVPHHVENAGFAHGVAQDLAAESVLTGYMRCRGTSGMSAILENGRIPLSGANPPYRACTTPRSKTCFSSWCGSDFAVMAAPAQPHPHSRTRITVTDRRESDDLMRYRCARRKCLMSRTKRIPRMRIR